MAATQPQPALTSDPTTILLEHNAWATRTLLDACRPLSDEQFHQRFDIGPGSLHDTLTHIIGAMRGWTDVLISREIRFRLEAQTRTIDELASLLDEFDSDLRAAAACVDHADILEGEAMGGRYRFAAGAVITHVTTHGFHHRAQAINMLRQLGQENIPDVSILRWMMAVDGRA